MGLSQKMLGSHGRREVKRVMPIVEKINELGPDMAKLTDAELRAKTAEFKERVEKGEDLDSILPEAFAVVREAADRVLGMKHFEVQLIGGIILHQGRIAEMKTGEGKTLVSTCPAYLNALKGEGVHIVTVNDYLAKRDAEWMGLVHKFLGLSVGVILHDMKDAERRAAYACDITYVTNNELGFDYLRDNMAIYKEQQVLRGLKYAIVDEVDSILIDEARTPLIISGQSGKSTKLYELCDVLAKRLEKGEFKGEMTKIKAIMQEEIEEDGDFVVNEKDKVVNLTEQGVHKVEEFFHLDNYADPENLEIQHNVTLALRAHNLMHRDKDYIVKDNEVIIVDEFTGRIMPGRRYSDGLHQAIEAKEHVQIKKESKTLATITFQNFFNKFAKKAGMTGTAATEEKEFRETYKMDVVPIPTNLPVVRVDSNDAVYKTKAGKFNAVISSIEESRAKEQPVLVGTVTIDTSEELSRLLKEKDIPHQVLNAKFHEIEAEIVAQAGKPGAVTIATNMAGRGTDIMLGGNAEMMARNDVKKKGYSEDVLIESTEHIDLAFRIGSPKEGTTLSQDITYIELANLPEKLDDTHIKDDVMPMLEERIAKVEDTESSEYLLLQDAIEARKLFVEKFKEYFPKVIRDREKVREAGGLKVIGTERHESRRIDNQLRGRSGRQGDPGESKFYISLEDNLMRLFGQERLMGIFNALGVDEDTEIEHKMLTKAIERAQQKIEINNYGMRSQLLQYDEVMNEQREIMYHERGRVLDNQNMRPSIIKMIGDFVNNSVDMTGFADGSPKEWDYSEIDELVLPVIPLDPITFDESVTTKEALKESLTKKAVAKYEEKEALFADPEQMREMERVILLKVIDGKWMNHIDDMEQLKQGVRLQSYAQRDPVVEYKVMGYNMFDEMLAGITEDTIKTLFQVRVEANVDREEVAEVHGESKSKGRLVNETASINPIRREGKKIRANDPCPCGSGKKYKNCCMDKDLNQAVAAEPAEPVKAEPAETETVNTEASEAVKEEAAEAVKAAADTAENVKTEAAENVDAVKKESE